MVSIHRLYKDYSFDHVPINHIDGKNQTFQVRSSHKQVYTYKAIAGRKFYFKMTDHVSIVVDAYVGLGVKNRVFHDAIFETGTDSSNNICKCTPLADPLKERSADINPTVHTGVLIGIAF